MNEHSESEIVLSGEALLLQGLLYGAVPAAVLAVLVCLSLILVEHNLKAKPILLLSEKSA